MALFLSSFLVLFLEVALIRWMPAYVRLLAYFSNFILLATFLGSGLGCVLARSRANLLRWFPALQLLLILAVKHFRLEVAVPSTTSIYFSSGTAENIIAVESTLLLPLLFVTVALVFVTVAQIMGRELTRRPPLSAYIINLLGSLSGVAAFALMSWLELPPVAWFAAAFAAAVALLVRPTPPLDVARGGPEPVEGPDTTYDVPPSYVVSAFRRSDLVVNVALLGLSLIVVYQMGRGSLWSPYYRVTLHEDGPDTVVEVNNIFHQSMAPVEKKEYFYQWPYTVFGDTFDDVLILGAGTGTDVAAALRHGAKHVDAVEIDPVILRLGAERHPDRPYSDPRVRTINDDARHFLTTSDKRYDLVVFALIDSLTVQSSFSSVRLESYMFTEESFRAVRDRLKPRGAMALYNYFREKWLVDRLANSVADAFGHEPLAHVHQERAYLAVMLAGPRLAELATPPPLPSLAFAYGQPHDPSPGRPLRRDPTIRPATDDWPFLYMRAPGLPRHYLAALGVVLGVSAAAVLIALAFAQSSNPSAIRNLQSATPFFFLGAGFMLLETKSIVQFALMWGSTWSSASLAIASVLIMALASAAIVSRLDIRRRGPLVAALVALIALNYVLPVGRVSFASRLMESAFYGALVFSPVLFAGLLFSSSYKRSSSTAADFGANLLGAMMGGVAEYLSLLAGYRFLLVLVGICYLIAVLSARSTSADSPRVNAPGTA